MANKRAGKHLITTCFEHPSVLETFKYLERKKEEGFEVTYLPGRSDGHISLEDLKAALRPDTIFVSVMMVNNEIGAVQDIAAIGKTIKAHNPDCIFHVDAVQGFGKYEIFPKKWNVDLLALARTRSTDRRRRLPLYQRQDQDPPDHFRRRPAKGQNEAERIMSRELQVWRSLLSMHISIWATMCAKMTMLKDQLTEGLEKLSAEIPEVDIRINSKKREASAPHIVSCVFAPVKSEVLLHALEEQGVYVSSGSACASNKPGLSGTLESIGLSKKEADCTLRFSFSNDNTAAQVEYTLEQLKELLPILSKFTSH